MGTPDEPGDEERGPLSPADDPVRQPESATASSALDTEAAALAFPLRREAVTLSRVLSRASEAWSNDIGTWVLAMVLGLMIGLGIPFLFGLVLSLFDLFSGSTQSDPDGAASALSQGLGIGAQILQTLVQGILYMGALAMAIHAVHEGPAQVGKLFSQVQKIWKYLILSFLVSAPLVALFALIVGVAYLSSGIDLDSPMDLVTQQMGPGVLLGCLVTAPFVIYALLGLFFGVTELVYNDDASAVEALTNSWRIARGKRWLMLGVLSIAWLIAGGSVLFCGVGALFGFPFALLMTAALYLGLRNGAEVSTARTDSTLGRPTSSGS